MSPSDAAAILWEHWQGSSKIDELPESARPATREAGYVIQAEIARLSGQARFGWKIAATSAVGQKHINVDGPLAGRLLAGRRKGEDEAVPLTGNNMNVAEAEFAFCMARSLPHRDTPYSVDEVMTAVASLHPAIEVPDSRYRVFTKVGGPQLIADTACACWYVIGQAASADWRTIDLAQHSVTAYRNGEVAGHGSGANVLGDPRLALTWIANEISRYDDGLGAGDVVITGTCLVPVAVTPGDRVRMDFGTLGTVQALLSA